MCTPIKPETRPSVSEYLPEKLLCKIISRYTTQQLPTFLREICDYIYASSDERCKTELAINHPELLFFSETICKCCEDLFLPRLASVQDTNQIKSVRDSPEFLKAVFLDISTRIMSQLERVTPCIDSEFITALSGEAYESASAKDLCIAIVPSSELPKDTSAGFITFKEAYRLQLTFENTHAVRKQLNLAYNGALAVYRNPEDDIFRTLGIVPESHVANYPRFLFHGHMRWSFCVEAPEPLSDEGDKKITNDCRVRYLHGTPMMPLVSLEKEVQEIVRSYFNNDDAEKISSIIISASNSKNGSILIFADKEIIDTEIHHLVEINHRGIQIIQSCNLSSASSNTLERLLSIDGALLIDSHGSCRAFGVILDGAIERSENPSEPSSPSDITRGARLNSCTLYVHSLRKRYPSGHIFAVVRSEDGMLDIIPRGDDLPI